MCVLHLKLTPFMLQLGHESNCIPFYLVHLSWYPVLIDADVLS